MAESTVAAFVTGGGSGIGRASALALALAGHGVGVADMDEGAAKSTAEEIIHAGGRAIALPIDVSDEAVVTQAVDRTVAELGRLTAAVNSAGIQGDLGPAGDCSLANWEHTLSVNLTGTFLSLRAEVRAMLASGGGSIVNIASNFGIVGRAGVPAYCASKHGVIGLTKSASLDYAAHGIRVNAVAPGPTSTPMVDKLLASSGDSAKQLLSEAEASIPMGRLGASAEVASAVVWLCSAGAAFTTGVTLPVDGGFVVG